MEFTLEEPNPDQHFKGACIARIFMSLLNTENTGLKKDNILMERLISKLKVKYSQTVAEMILALSSCFDYEAYFTEHKDDAQFVYNEVYDKIESEDLSFNILY